MRRNCRKLVGVAAATLALEEPIFEFGSYDVGLQGDFADLRPFFPGKAYVGCDMRPGPGVDRVLDLHSLDLPDQSVGTVICLDTIEHVEYPWQAMNEIWRVLAPHGTVILTSVMNFPIHNYPHDYWRFSPEAFRSLLKRFPRTWVGKAGRPDFPHTVAAIACRSAEADLSSFTEEADLWAKRQRWEFEHVVEALMPPVLMPMTKAVGRVVYRALGRQI